MEKKRPSSVINSLNITCENSEKGGCKEILSLNNIIIHQCNCDFGKYTCPLCPTSGLLNKVIENHALECENRKISCPKCKMIIKFKDSIEHLENSCLEILS